MTIKLRAAAAIAATFLVAAPAFADEFRVKIPNVAGDAVGPRGYEDWITATSFSLGFARGVCSSFVMTKNVDLASPALTVAAMLGTTYAAVEAVAIQDGPYESGRLKLKLVLVNAVVTSLQQSGNEGTGTLQESVSIQPEQVRMTYYAPTGTGGSLVPFAQTVDCQRFK